LTKTMQGALRRTARGDHSDPVIYASPGRHVSRPAVKPVQDSSRRTEILRYTSTAIALHWLIAIALAGQIAFGWYLNEIERGTPERSLFVNLHKSSGLILGVAIAFRLFWRLTHAAPALPEAASAWERIGSRASHAGLYVCMLAMPLSGYVASNFSRWGVKLFNVFVLPPWGTDSPKLYAFFNGIHVFVSYLFVSLICLHVLAALRHLAMRDGTFMRMWPKPRHNRQ
jgi:cytochrome b561